MTTQQKDYFGENLTPAQRMAKRREREEKQALENKRLGLLVFQISWIMAFMALIMVNWQLRFQYETWPPPGVRAMGVGLPTLATLLLLGSVILARRSRKAIEANRLKLFTHQWRGALLLTAVFVGIMAVEWLRVETGTQYSAVFRLMTGFHSLHAVAVGVFMVMVLRNAAQHIENSHHWGIEAASKMMDFVFVAWLLFYVVLYWWRSG